MATVNYCAFATHDLTESYSTAGTAVYSSTPTHSGYGSLKTAAGAGHARYRAIGTSGLHDTAINLATTYFTFHYWFESFPASSNEPFFAITHGLSVSAAVKIEGRITSAGKVQIYDTSIAQIGSDGATTLSTGKWYRFDVSVATGVTAAYEVKIDGIVEFSGTAAVSSNNSSYVALGHTVSRNGQTFTGYADTIFVSGSAYAVARPKIVRLDPNGDGSGGWTAGPGGSGNNWYDHTDDYVGSGVDDADSTYIYSTSSASPPADTAPMTLTDCVASGMSAGATIASVKSYGRMKDMAGTTRVNMILRSNSVDSGFTADADLGTGYVSYAQIRDTDFGRSNIAWTIANVDSLQIVFDNNTVGATEVRCTAAAVMVLYSVPPSKATYTPHAGI